MPYRPISIPSFGGGLNLRDKVDVVRSDQAIDCLNVVFTETGAVKTRDGYDNLTVAELTNRADSLAPFITTAGDRQLLVGAGTRLSALSTAGAVIASATGLAGGPYTFVNFGTPNATVAYAGNGTDTLRQWSGTAWSAPTGTVNAVAASALPKAGALALWPTVNRLVATGFATTTGGPAGATTSPSHVYFSNLNDPLTWETDGTSGRGRNFIQLTPGDGETIQGVISWGSYVFVFKQSKFFVFYGEGVDAAGNPVFSYRTVDNGVGAISRRAITVGPDGVYFLDRTGVYRTQGDKAELASDAVGPIFRGGLSPYFLSSSLNHAAITATAMSIVDNRLYLSLPTADSTTPDRTLVYDLLGKWWSIFDIAAAAMTGFRTGDVSELHFAYATGLKHVARLSSSVSTDEGVAIASRWRSGWADFGNTVVKTLRESKLWGTGSLTLGVSRDFEIDARTSNALVLTAPSLWGDFEWDEEGVLWGPITQPVAKLSRKSERGTVFSVILSGSAAWGLNRMDHHVRETHPPSMVEA